MGDSALIVVVIIEITRNYNNSNDNEKTNKNTSKKYLASRIVKLEHAREVLHLVAYFSALCLSYSFYYMVSYTDCTVLFYTLFYFMV